MCEFQFHSGSIKSELNGIGLESFTMFQFHSGSIKRDVEMVFVLLSEEVSIP